MVFESGIFYDLYDDSNESVSSEYHKRTVQSSTRFFRKVLPRLSTQGKIIKIFLPKQMLKRLKITVKMLNLAIYMKIY